MKKNTLSILLIFVLSFSLSAGGPWVKGKKKGYFQLSFTSLQYDELLNGFQDPNSGLNREVTDLTLQAYLEYGPGKNWQVEMALPFKLLKTGDQLLDVPGNLYPADTLAAGKLNAFGNIHMAVKYLILDGKFKMAGKLSMGAKTAEYDSITGLRSGYDAWYFAPSFSVGRGYRNFYYFTEAGYRFKTNGYSSDFLFTLEAF
ncbi:MAG: hypothetical protein U5Q03_07790 [Bacteroidota bacterium]|nr:hypothetical protein [Bacteroidota bacterium]